MSEIPVFQPRFSVLEDPLVFMKDTPHDLDLGDIKACLACTRAEDYRGAQRAGPSGPLDAEYVFIGRDPGAVEARNDFPFHPTAPIGSLFAQYLERLGLTREKVYVTNTCFCRGTDDRPLRDSERETCTQTWKDIEMLRLPKVKAIFAVGVDALKACLGWDMAADPNQMWVLPSWPGNENPSVLVFYIFHPGYVTRRPGLLTYMGDQLCWIREKILKDDNIAKVHALSKQADALIKKNTGRSGGPILLS